MTKHIASLCLFSALAASPAIGSAGKPATPAVPDSTGYVRVADVLVTSLDDFRGAIVATPSGEKTQVLELTWGLNQATELFPAYMKIVQEDGTIFERDDRKNATEVFDSLDQVKGCYLPWAGRAGIWVEDVQFGVLPDGRMCILGSKALGTDGQIVDTMLAAETTRGGDGPRVPVCQAIGTWGCGSTSGCSIPSSSCSNPPSCPCSPGQGSCPPNTTWECAPGAWCPPQQACTLQPSGTDCRCE